MTLQPLPRPRAPQLAPNSVGRGSRVTMPTAPCMAGGLPLATQVSIWALCTKQEGQQYIQQGESLSPGNPCHRGSTCRPPPAPA